MSNTALIKAAELISSAEALLIGAGAGIGVDSGLPDFRGNKGFWKAYPIAEKLNLNFQQLATPENFRTNPGLAWGFYGHRYHLYKSTIPHKGFEILKKWVDHMKYGGFIYTRNVDGHFQKSEFNKQHIIECHGSINHLQCINGCGHDIWQTGTLNVTIDFPSLTATSGIPACPHCGDIARPNILMFNDYGWISDRTYEQEDLYRNWITHIKNYKLVIIEIGAGTYIPTVRYECGSHNKPLIRINPRQYFSGYNNISISLGALDALTSIDKYILQR